MNKMIIILIAVSMNLSGYAQVPPAGINASSGRQVPPPVGRLYGKLVDSTGKGIRDASVLLLQNKLDTLSGKVKEVLIKGVSTQANGEFNMEGLPVVGQFKLDISAVGYQASSQPVSFLEKIPGGAPGGTSGNASKTGIGTLTTPFEKDLGKIVLNADAQMLTGVVVTAAPSGRLRMDIDKKIFNVDQNIVSAGGTAVDVMKNVPSVNVDSVNIIGV